MENLCKLCLEPKKLLSKSHIIPDFVYRETGMYDTKHRVQCYEVIDNFALKKNKPMQSGDYCSNILCQTCDNEIIGSYERYAARVTYQKNIKETITITPKGSQYIIQGIDSNQYKLYLLSILFKAAICTNDFYSEICLSDESTEKLRKMVYEGNAGNINDFPIVIEYLSSPNIPEYLIWCSPKITQNGLGELRFLFSKKLHTFYEGCNLKLSDSISKKIINQNQNELIINHASKIDYSHPS